MSSVHSPQEKKALAYRRDHYAKGKHDKGFRKGWPLKKRRPRRSFRRAAKVITESAVQDPEVDVRIGSVKIKRAQKWGVQKLGEHVEYRLEKRKRRVGSTKARLRSSL